MDGFKGYMQSKGIWTSIIGALLAIAAMFGVLPEDIDKEQVSAAVLLIISVATGIFRARATKALPAAASLKSNNLR